MTKPYWIDLRERAVARFCAGESFRSVAAILYNSASRVVTWAQRPRSTSSFAAGQMGGHRPRVLVGQHRVPRDSQDENGLVRDLAGGGFIAAQRNAVLVGGCVPASQSSPFCVIRIQEFFVVDCWTADLSNGVRWPPL